MFTEIAIIVAAVIMFWTLIFLWGATTTDNSVADIGWGLGFGVIALVSLGFSELTLASLVITAAALIWGLRLSGFIAWRKRGKGEDWRYRQFRKEWKGNVLLNSFFRIFMLQGFLMLIIALPIIFTNLKVYQGLSPWLIAGFIVWLIGFLTETVADWQKYMFKQNPANKDKIIQSGLWKYSRHPNYFGEIVVWIGIWLMSVPSGYVFITVLSPILISFLLIFVSGIPFLEKRYQNRSGWEEYRARTSLLIPWPPKKS